MKCSISGCSNAYEKGGITSSFHKFPHNPKVLTAWVAATGTPNFIPTNTSKICSFHFEESAYLLGQRKLKPEAVPTKLLTENARRRVLACLGKGAGNTTACVLGSNTSMQQDAVVMNTTLPQASSTALVPSPAPTSSIKLVDVNTLLEPQSTRKQIEPTKSPKTVSNALVNQSNYSTVRGTLKNNTDITASQVFSCLRVILPGKFDLTRMIPNEKVASLVIRYLKLDDKNQDYQNTVKNHLKIIIEAVKSKDKKSKDDFSKHPYNKINDVDLQSALAMILPQNFSMIDITAELLGLICIALNQEIYSDAYYILISKIRKFTSEGQRFNEILNCGSKVIDASLEVEKDAVANICQINPTGIRAQFNCINNGESESIEFVDVNNSDVNTLEPRDLKLSMVNQSPKNSFDSIGTLNNKPNYSELDCENDISKVDKSKKKKSDYDYDWNPAKKKFKHPKVKKRQLPQHVQKLTTIVSYLHKNGFSAKDALENYRLLFDLCRHVQIRLKNSNVTSVKSRLNYIIDNKINIKNVKRHLKQVMAEHICNQSLNHQSKNVFRGKNDIKLKMRPVVILKNVLDFELEQMLFMKRASVKSNGSYKTVPFSLKQHSPQKYTTEQVRKLTDESYKKFRKIIFKRNGSKGFFQVKYTKLNPGTVVYAKNYRHPAVGWVKGVVGQQVGPLKYQVDLDSDNRWLCSVDQLRPIFNENNLEHQRPPRPIKPKQLFDL